MTAQQALQASCKSLFMRPPHAAAGCFLKHKQLQRAGKGLSCEGDKYIASLAPSTSEVGCTSTPKAHFARSHTHLDDALWRYLRTALAPDSAQAHELLAHTLRDMGSVEEAVRRYKIITAQRTTQVALKMAQFQATKRTQIRCTIIATTILLVSNQRFYDSV